MDMIVYVLIVLIAAGAICAIVYTIPFPAPLAWLKWAIPLVVVVIALLWLLGHFAPHLPT